MLRVQWTDLARADLAQQVAYYDAINPLIGEAIDEAINAAVNGLPLLPYKGRPGARENTRELVITRYPFLVIYTVQADRIVILRVWHTSQNWKEYPLTEQ